MTRRRKGAPPREAPSNGAKMQQERGKGGRGGGCGAGGDSADAAWVKQVDWFRELLIN